MPDSGPYEDERAASAAARAVIPPDPGWAILSQSQRYELMRRAFAAAGVETSAFEDTSAWWLANYEDYLAAMIAGWVTRAYEAGRASALPEGTVTRWAIGHGEYGVTNCENEADARDLMRFLDAPGNTSAVVSCLMTPWTLAPEVTVRDETEEDNG